MKKMLLMCLLSCFALTAFGEITVGKIDMQKILTQTKQGKKIASMLKKEFKKKEKELKGLEKKLMEKKQNFDKQKVLKNKAWQQKKEMELQKEFISLQKKTQQYQKDIQQLEMKKKQPMLKSIKDVIHTVSKKNKVDITFEINTAPVMYAKNVKDLTVEVIALYDKKHK